MKKILFSIALMGVFACSAGQQPVQIEELSISTADCTVAADTATISVSATGGTAPYTFTFPGTAPVVGTSATFNAIPGTTNPAVITITDSTTPSAGVTTVNVGPLPSLFDTVSLSGELGCSGVNLNYVVAPRAATTTLRSVSITSTNGFSRTITDGDLDATVPNLLPGTYTLVFTPASTVTGLPAACSNALTVKFVIGFAPFALTSVRNTELSDGTTNGQVVATVTGGTSPLTAATLTGPLPGLTVIPGSIPTAGNSATFTGLEGGFYTLTLTDSDSCTVTRLVTVNFFANALSNRIALAYCNAA